MISRSVGDVTKKIAFVYNDKRNNRNIAKTANPSTTEHENLEEHKKNLEKNRLYSKSWLPWQPCRTHIPWGIERKQTFHARLFQVFKPFLIKGTDKQSTSTFPHY